MADHFSVIGFKLNSEEEFMGLVGKLAEGSEQIKAKKGKYLFWSDGTGAEMWLQVGRFKKLIGANPHFKGTSVVKVAITNQVFRPGQSVLDGAFHAWADPEDGDPESGIYPFVFDCPDFRIYKKMKLPFYAQVQVAAFPHTIEYFETEEAFAQSQDTEMKFSPQSFVPAGLFAAAEQGSDAPGAFAVINGIVSSSKELTNSLSGERFYWAEIESAGGTYDVVIDPVMLEDIPSPGGVISGDFWLSGRILND